jgi:hypothetical protein
MVVGADPQTRALGTLFPVYSGTRLSVNQIHFEGIHFEGIHFGRHSTGEFGTYAIIYIEHGR